MVPLCSCNLHAERIGHDRQQHGCLGKWVQSGAKLSQWSTKFPCHPKPWFQAFCHVLPFEDEGEPGSQEHACYDSKKAECLLKIGSGCLQVRPESGPVTSRSQSLCPFSGRTHQPYLEDRVQSTSRIKDGFQVTIENQCTLHNQDQGSVSKQTASQCAVCMQNQPR